MSKSIYHVGDALKMLKRLGSETVQCCVTSPPYWGLRDYGTAKWEGGNPDCDHRHQLGGEGINSAKQNTSAGTQTIAYRDICKKCGAQRIDCQIGIEQTPDEYVNNLVRIFREVRRVLRPDGTLWLNLGDSYGRGSRAKFAGDKKRKSGMQQKIVDADGYSAGVIFHNKQLVGIPWQVAFALRADGWYLRQDIIWHKPNPMPESIRDRCTKAHEYIFLMTKSARYYYDVDAIRESGNPEGSHSRGCAPARPLIDVCGGNQATGKDFITPSSGRNKRSVWTVASQPHREAHFAVFPPKLIEPCILAGTSEKGNCVRCGAPWQRIVERKPMGKKLSNRKEKLGSKGQTCCSGAMTSPPESRTVGWKPSCDCKTKKVQPAIVLDPFAGSGTAGVVANKLGRHAILIDLNPEYRKMAKRRFKKQDDFDPLLRMMEVYLTEE